MRLDFVVRCKQSRLQDCPWLCRGSASQSESVMKLTTIVAAALLAGATLSSVFPAAEASPGSQGRSCIAKVVHSGELPFAPIGNWLVKVSLEIIPPNGNAYQTTLQDWMPWQGPPPRRGQEFRVQCEPANPRDLHLTSHHERRFEHSRQVTSCSRQTSRRSRSTAIDEPGIPRESPNIQATGAWTH